MLLDAKATPVEPPAPVKPEEKEKTSTAEKPKSKKSTELLKFEEKDFTLTVERPPSTDPQKLTPVTLDSIVKNPETGETEITHVVKKNDTLWHIADKYLGDPWKFSELAKMSMIKDPDLIYPGDIIRITKKDSDLGH